MAVGREASCRQPSSIRLSTRGTQSRSPPQKLPEGKHHAAGMYPSKPVPTSPINHVTSTSCHTVESPSKRCETVYSTKKQTVCNPVPRQSSQNVCKQVPRQSCRSVPQNSCRQVPYTVCP